MQYCNIMENLTYFKPYVDDDGFIHSIDKCSITFVLKKQTQSVFPDILEKLDELSTYYECIPEKKLDCPARSSLGWCKHFYKFRYGLVVFIGYYQFIDKTKDFQTVYNCRLEFNPNKQLVRDSGKKVLREVFDDKGRKKDLFFETIFDSDLILDLVKYFKSISSEIYMKRIDYAVDVPVNYKNIIVPQSLKGKQVYDTTRYFGSPGSHGRLKIYDKQREAALDHELTRIEYTFKYNNQLNFEKVYLLEDGKMEVEKEKLTSNTRVITRLCLALKASGIDYTDYLKDLDSRKRKTVIEAVEGRGKLIIQDASLVNYLILQLSDYLGIDINDNKVITVDKNGFVQIDDNYIQEELPFLEL